MAEVTLSNLSKSYGPAKALSNVTMTIPTGAFVVLLGPTGAGKTTTLRLIAGLDKPDAGDIRIAGNSVLHDTPAQRDVAMVFQQYSLYPHLTVRDNLAFPLRSPMIAMPEADIARRVQEVAEVLRIPHKLDNKATALSGGEMQRVSIGRALVRNPRIYLMDEPLSSLDAKLRADLRIELKRIHADMGATFLYVTHDQIEAMTMADRIVVMQGGRIEQVGAPLELYDRPANVFVAAFIGSPSMNLLEGRVSGRMVDIGGSRLPLPSGVAAEEGRDVIYGIRPEHLHQAEAGLPATVAVIEPTGAETHVVLRSAGRDLTAVFRNRVAFAPGAAITLAPDPAAAHVFDKATGQRI